MRGAHHVNICVSASSFTHGGIHLAGITCDFIIETWVVAECSLVESKRSDVAEELLPRSPGRRFPVMHTFQQLSELPGNTKKQ